MSGVTVSSTLDDSLLDRVRELRAAGLSPKHIARTLGVRPAVVSPLVRAAAQSAARGAAPALVGCWVSPGWSGGLSVPGDRDWPEVAAGAEGVAGMAAVVVVRRQRPHRVSACGYLVDTHCLGVKNTLGPRSMGDRELPGFVRMFFAAFEQAGPPLEAPLELARHLVWGAVDAARRLGFEPAPDFASTAEHLGAWAQDSAIEFGRDGVPSYVEGPYDNAAAVIRTLTRTVGAGNFQFLLSADTALTR